MTAADRGYLVTIRETIQRIEHAVVEGEAAFHADAAVQERVRRGLQTVGKSARRVSAELRGQAARLAWPLLDGLAEFAGDAQRAWACVRDELPGLKQAVDDLLGTTR